MKRKIMREKDDRWCEVTIEIDAFGVKDGRLSVCGAEGSIVKRSLAKRMAIDYWESYFDDEKGAIQEMNERTGSRCITARGAAKHVVSIDGEFHGLDVHKEDGDRVYLLESCGQIRREVAEWFPEVVPLLPWHLNDMRAGCEHQEALGWGNDKLSVPCPTCGYKYGTAWKKRELPANVIELALSVAS